MIERTPMLMAALLGVLALTACGDRGAAPGTSGGPRTTTEEPIDAVPLPLDDNPLTPPPVVTAPVVAKAAPATEEAVTAEPTPGAVNSSAPVEDGLTPPKIVVTPPRDPARPLDRPQDRPVERPTSGASERPVQRAPQRPADRPAAPAPASPSADRKEPEKPVLTF